MREYVVVGFFRQPHKDCEAETQTCKTYNEALLLKAEWKKQRKYKQVCIVKY